MPVTLVTVNTFLEVITRNQRHNLRKYGLFCTHHSKSEPFEAHLKSTKFNPKIQETIYLINFQRLKLHILDFIRTVVKYNKKVAMIVVCISNKMLIYTKSENPENDVFLRFVGM